jgi:acetyltransferase-like isoleucine patch superfamily enzyme
MQKILEVKNVTKYYGAGSVVTHDIPAGVIAAGVPCKVIRPITEKDKFKPEDILF